MWRTFQRSSLSLRRFLTTSSPTSLSRLTQPTVAPTFHSLNLHPSIAEALHSISITTPTHIQKQSLPPLLNHQTALLAAETGSGKTLAYLCPLLSRLKTSEVNIAAAPIEPLPNRPKVLILAPTRELVAQICTVAKGISHHLKLRIRGYSGGSTAKAVARLRNQHMDVLVCTPGGVQTLRERGLMYLSRVEALVLDEADELLADKAMFGEQLNALLQALREKQTQHVYVAATVPAELERALRRTHAGLVEVRGRRLHRVKGVREVNTTFIRVDGADEAKFFKLKEIVSSAVGRKEVGKMLVFCDREERRVMAVECLKECGVAAVHLSASTRRGHGWKAFVDGDVRVGVCAKSYSRGIDDEAINVVVLIDVPMSGAEYVHRIGRIRGGGKAYVLVNRREHAIAEQLFLSQVRGEKVAGVNAREAWRRYTGSGRDRLLAEGTVRKAKREKMARWVDERQRASGSFRGNVGRAEKRRLRMVRKEQGNVERRERKLAWG